MGTMLIYPKLRKSIYDQEQSAQSVKIRIRKRMKERNNARSYNGIELRYCKLGICESQKKFCNGIYDYCPYQIVKAIEQPRKGSKAYDEYLYEFNLQMTGAFFRGHLNEQVEKAIYGELSDPEYRAMVISLSNKSSDFYKIEDYVTYNPLIRAIYMENAKKLKEEKSKVKQEHRMFYEVGEYLYIDISYLPNVKLDDVVVLRHGDNWIKKCNLTPFTLGQIERNEGLQSWLRNDYDNNIKILKRQLEEEFGLITLIKLQESL